MMKGTVMTKTALTAAIAESCEVKKGVIAKALSTLASIATAETKKNGKFVVPGLVMIQLPAASPATDCHRASAAFWVATVRGGAGGRHM